jgi:hypothetical protein
MDPPASDSKKIFTCAELESKELETKNCESNFYRSFLFFCVRLGQSRWNISFVPFDISRAGHKMAKTLSDA